MDVVTDLVIGSIKQQLLLDGADDTDVDVSEPVLYY